jgi:WD40 repeat protein
MLKHIQLVAFAILNLSVAAARATPLLSNKHSCEQLFFQSESHPKYSQNSIPSIHPNEFASLPNPGLNLETARTSLNQTLLDEYADLTRATNQALNDGDQSLAATLFKVKKQKFLELKALGLVGTSQQIEIQHSIGQSELIREQVRTDTIEKAMQAKGDEKILLPWHEVLKIQTGIGSAAPSFFNASYSADNSKILVSSDNLPVGVFSTETGKLLKSIDYSSFSKFSIRSDGTFAFNIRSDGTDKIDILSTESNTDKFTIRATIKNILGASGRFDQAIYNPDESKIAVVRTFLDKKIRIYDAQTGKLLTRIKKGFIGLVKIKFNPNGTLLAVTDYSPQRPASTIYLFNTRTGELVAKLDGGTEYSHFIEFSQDGKLLLGTDDSAARIWQLDEVNKKNDQINTDFSLKSPRRQLVIAIQPFDRQFKYFSTISTLKSNVEFIRESKSFFHSVLFSPNGKQTLTVSHADENGGNAVLWDNISGQEVLKLEPPRSNALLWHIKFSHDGSLIAATDGDHTIFIWSTKTGKIINSISNPENILASFEFSKDDRQILTASRNYTLRIWEQIEFHN